MTDICPGVNREAIPDYLDPGRLPAIAAVLKIDNCDAFLPGATCTASPFNFPTPVQAVTPAFYGLGALPTGTKSVWNNAGGLSSPISGDVLTWSVGSGVTTVATAVKATGGSSSGSLGQAALVPGGVVPFTTTGIAVVMIVWAQITG